MDAGAPAYAGTMALRASTDACGEFIYGFDSADTLFSDPVHNSHYPRLIPLTIIAEGCDCNDDGMIDVDAIALGTSKDCNNNRIPDDCDIASGYSHDRNNNGVPDECRSSSLPPRLLIQK